MSSRETVDFADFEREYARRYGVEGPSISSECGNEYDPNGNCGCWVCTAIQWGLAKS